MKIGWGWKIMILYGGFMAMIITLVTASSHQKIDLVSKDYYKDEIAYQDVLNASKNQAQLATNPDIHANSSEVVIEFPADVAKQVLKGNVNFYAAVNKEWDKNFAINVAGNKMVIPRSALHDIVYQLKISYTADGKQYYYETRLDLHKS